MRHHLVHCYFDVDPEIVWAAISERIPELKAQVEAALESDPQVRSES
jgi:uncharacterized protein with HEPN domain